MEASIEALDQRLFVERVRLLARDAPIGMAASAINASVLTLVMWNRVPSGPALVWLACQLTSLAVRCAAHLRRRGTPPADLRAAERRLLGFRAAALVSGLLWGASAALLYPPESLPHQIFLAFALGGMAAGASSLFALDLTSFSAYALPSLAPLAVRLLAGGEAIHLAMAGMLCLFGVFIGWIALHNHRSLLTSLHLRVENVDLIDSLTLEKDRAERLNRDLSEEILERERAEQDLLAHRHHLEELVEERTRGLKEANERLREVVAECERAEQRSSRVAREWTSTFDNMLDMVAIVSPDMKITRANAPLARFLSVHPGELVGRTCHEMLHGLAEPWPECPHREALTTHCAVSREVDDPHMGIPLLLTCSPFTDAEGRVLGTVHVARDISEQKRAELKREEIIAELQQAVANVKLLSGLLPICSSCKKIRDDRGYWTQIETYIQNHSEADFTHGICPECAQRLYPEYFRDRKR